MIDAAPKFLLNFCPTGAVHGKGASPHVPISFTEIVTDCQMALRAGAQMLHIHGRDAAGKQTSDPEVYAPIIEELRKLEGGDQAVVCVTTTGRADADPIKRAQVLGLTGQAKPDMASLTLSSLNFMQGPSINAPKTIEYLAAQMKEAGIRPELEVFDLGMANMVHVLIKKGLIDPPYYINFLLGNIATAQANVHHFAALLATLPSDAVVCVGGLGRFQANAHRLGLMFTHGVRVGLEDNLKVPAGHSACDLATNQELMAAVMAQARLMGLTPMSRPQARKLVLGEG